MNAQTVIDYAEEMIDGAVFPPVIIFHDGANLWLGDGYHRIEAAKKIIAGTARSMGLEVEG